MDQEMNICLSILTLMAMCSGVSAQLPDLSPVTNRTAALQQWRSPDASILERYGAARGLLDETMVFTNIIAVLGPASETMREGLTLPPRKDGLTKWYLSYEFPDGSITIHLKAVPGIYREQPFQAVFFSRKSEKEGPTKGSSRTGAPRGGSPAGQP
jgi:hypothetical protein